MGNLAFQELLILLLIFLVVPIAFYSLGKRSGYKQGQLDVYKKWEEEKRSKS